MSLIDAPPAWEVSYLFFAHLMQQSGMYVPSAHGGNEGVSAQLTPGHLEVRRLRYSAGNALVVVFDFLESGAVHVAGLRPGFGPAHFREHDMTLHACTFSAGDQPSPETFRRMFLHPYHSLCLRLARKRLRRTTPGHVPHVFFQQLVSNAGELFQYEHIGDGRHVLRIDNCVQRLIALAYGIPSDEDEDDQDDGAGGLPAKSSGAEIERLNTILSAEHRDVAALFHSLWSRRDWWPNFAEFAPLAAHAHGYQHVTQQQVDTRGAAMRVRTLGYLMEGAMYASISNWQDSAEEEVAYEG